MGAAAGRNDRAAIVVANRLARHHLALLKALNKGEASADDMDGDGFRPRRPVEGGKRRAGLLPGRGNSFSLGGRLHSHIAKAYPEARSSAGEHFPDTEGVGGSIPPVPTNYVVRKSLQDPWRSS